jgi:hypothetical protein
MTIYVNDTYDQTGAVVASETIDTEAGTVTYDPPRDGVTTRPLTLGEADSITGEETTIQLVAESDESVDKLVLVVEALNAITALTNAEINANPAAVIKDLARECKTIARQANREARLTSGRTESTDTGDIIDA